MTIDKFLEKLTPFESKVVISPLNEVEVNSIETILDRRLPEYYREFLLSIGLKQDVIWGLNDRISDFKPLDDFLPNGEAEKFFRFGNNGGEDYWLLRNDDPNDRTIYEYDYYCDYEIKSLKKTFDDLLRDAIQQLTKKKDSLTDNSQKVWAVQFSIDVDNVTDIIAALDRDIGCSLSEAIQNMKVSSAGVISSTGRIKLQEFDIPIKKQEYSGWETASYYFNWEEPVSDMNHNSFIKKIESCLKNAGLKAILIDYGIMPKT